MASEQRESNGISTNEDLNNRMRARKRILFIDSQGKIIPRRRLFFNSLIKNDYILKGIMWDRTCSMKEFEFVGEMSLRRIRIKANYADVKAAFKIFAVYLKMGLLILRERFNVIHCGHLSLLLLALVAGKMRGGKVIYDVAEFYTVGFFERLGERFGWLEKLLLGFENLLVKRVNGVICPPSIANVYGRRYRAYNHNVRVVMNVPELADNYDSEMTNSSLGKAYERRKVVIFSGTINKRNGAYKILEALPGVIAQFPETLLLFVGDAKKDKVPLERIVERLDLWDFVEFTGYVSYEMMQNYLKVSDVGLASMVQPEKCTPYRLMTKGNSRKLGEYMRAGLPIVSSDYGEISLVVREEGCGFLVDSTDSKQIAEAICYLLANTKEAKRMGDLGKKAFKTKYNWGLEEQHFLTVYSHLWE